MNGSNKIKMITRLKNMYVHSKKKEKYNQNSNKNKEITNDRSVCSAFI